MSGCAASSEASAPSRSRKICAWFRRGGTYTVPMMKGWVRSPPLTHTNNQKGDACHTGSQLYLLRTRIASPRTDDVSSPRATKDLYQLRRSGQWAARWRVSCIQSMLSFSERRRCRSLVHFLFTPLMLRVPMRSGPPGTITVRPWKGAVFRGVEGGPRRLLLEGKIPRPSLSTYRIWGLWYQLNIWRPRWIAWWSSKSEFRSPLTHRSYQVRPLGC